ncbi:MAG: glycosyltransferase family 2 protein [Planctomycetaceae bacterium]|nr:glycosyltransferase family 2 protein [Planctomycetaceae bacterium]
MSETVCDPLAPRSSPPATPVDGRLSLLSVIIPARDEAGCIASTVEHLHLELRLQDVPHEIIVVDDGSTDATWEILKDLADTIPALRPVQNDGEHGFGRAIVCGINTAQGDAVVIMMADESDDCRDVVRYWQLLNAGHDCVRQPLPERRRRHRLSLAQAQAEPSGQLRHQASVPNPTARHNQRFQGVPQKHTGRLPPLSVTSLQSHGGVAAEGHCSRLHLDNHSDHLAKSPLRSRQTQDQRNGQPLFLHHGLLLAGKILQPRRLQTQRRESSVVSRQSPVKNRSPLPPPVPAPPN